ncbi:MAG: hypothetical protein J6N15_09475 [Ruminiclostridium sp.]|nr:hypothetical protein [Ruminiclostridium sp.]
MEKETAELYPSHKRVLDYMVEHGSIDTMRAIKDLGNTRLSAAIYAIRRGGIPVSSEWKEVRNRYGDVCRVKRYFIQGAEK